MLVSVVGYECVLKTQVKDTIIHTIYNNNNNNINNSNNKYMNENIINNINIDNNCVYNGFSSRCQRFDPAAALSLFCRSLNASCNRSVSSDTISLMLDDAHRQGNVVD